MIFKRKKYLDELIAGRGVRLSLLAMIFTARRTNLEY